MGENEKVIAYEKKLVQLKEEEKMIMKILKDVQNQLKKYEVEELQTSSELVSERRKEGEEEEDEDDSESDESIVGKPESLLKILDSAELVNDASLNLNLTKIFGNENDESEENDELEESD